MGLFTGAEYARLAGADLCQPGRGLQHKNTAVPVIIAGREVALGAGRIGFFGEFIDLTGARPPGLVYGPARVDIAITGLGPRRRDAESHQIILERQRMTGLDRRMEGVQVLNQMIGRHHHDHGVFILSGERQGGDGQGRRRIAALGLKDNLAYGPPAPGGLLGHQKAMRLIADDQRVCNGQPAHRFIESGQGALQ